MDLKTQKRIASNILNVGSKRVWFDPARLDEIKESITRTDIKSLIKDKAIQAKKLVNTSRVRARKIKLQKSKGRRKNKGSRKGKRTARLSRKQGWMKLIRLQRKFLRELKLKNIITTKIYRMLILKAKGGFFRSKRHIKLYIGEQGLAKKEK